MLAFLKRICSQSKTTFEDLQRGIIHIWVKLFINEYFLFYFYSTNDYFVKQLVFEIFWKKFNSELFNVTATQRHREKKNRRWNKALKKMKRETASVESIASAAIAAATGGGQVDSGVIYVSVSDLYSHDRSADSAAGKWVDRSWKYINCSQTHECENWVGTEAAQFRFFDYINGIFVAVWLVRFGQRYTTWFSPQHLSPSFFAVWWLKQYCEGLLKPESCSCLASSSGERRLCQQLPTQLTVWLQL